MFDHIFYWFLGPEYARLVFASSTEGDNLFSSANLKSMCKLEDDIARSSTNFGSICIRSRKTRRCCRSWSLGNYVALLNNKSSCYEIDDLHIQRALELVGECQPYFQTHFNVPHCWTPESEMDLQCTNIPERCREHSAAYSILYYLTDVEFANGNHPSHVTFAMSFLPVAASVGAKELYYDVERRLFSDGITKIVAINFGIKQEVFDQYLMTDMVWFSIGLFCVIILMWVYTASLFITIMTNVLIFLSVEISFCLYAFVFQIHFFPFMNLLVVVILIGIGVDDVFIYWRIWYLGKSQKNSMTFEKLVATTLKHATLSVSVTSLTTAVAFYSSYVSSVTVLRCFAIFAGTAVIVNFVLMVLWMPAVIIVNEKWWSSYCPPFNHEFFQKRAQICSYFCSILSKIFVAVTCCCGQFFFSILPCIVLKLRYLWLVLLGMLGIGAAVIVLYYPRLRLPSRSEFQLFAHEHFFEVYDFKMKDIFYFERALKNDSLPMPITVVWGVESVRIGNSLDPLDKGELVFDKKFDISTREAQRYLLKFCTYLRSSKYYLQEAGIIRLTNCFMENFRIYMKRSCRSINETSLAPCCGSSFPIKKDIFNYCIREYIPLLTESTFLSPFLYNPNAGLRFDRDHDKPVAVIVEFSSNQQFSLNYSEMRDFFSYIDEFVMTELKSAPAELKNGWFVSYLSFYDLQKSIAEGTPLAIGVSVSVALAVAFMTTLNVLITFYSMLTITAAIFVTVAILVVIGWELNVLESVTISVAVGLSIDYSLHHGMAYRLSPELDRRVRAVDAMQNIGSPVAMAAVTTFLVGLSLMPSTILAYRQLGVFLMIVISVSWTYATFFFQSLLMVVGPKGGFGQLHWPRIACKRSSYEQKHHIDKTVYTMSDSTLSSSSAMNHANSGETQELEQLAEHLQPPSRFVQI